MNDSRSSSNNSILLFLSGLVALLLIVLIIFSMSKINKMSEQIATESVKLEESKETLIKLRQLELLRPELEGANRILTGQMPEVPSEEGLIEYIYKLTENNKTDFIEIKFEERKQKNDMIEMPFKLTLNGKYSSVLGFMNNISNGERLIRIDEIQIDSMGSVNGVINTSITANAFFKEN